MSAEWVGPWGQAWAWAGRRGAAPGGAGRAGRRGAAGRGAARRGAARRGAAQGSTRVVPAGCRYSAGWAHIELITSQTRLLWPQPLLSLLGPLLAFGLHEELEAKQDGGGQLLLALALLLGSMHLLIIIIIIILQP
jgi:hypothetical protein